MPSDYAHLANDACIAGPYCALLATPSRSDRNIWSPQRGIVAAGMVIFALTRALLP